jgi:hypothetical protein
VGELSPQHSRRAALEKLHQSGQGNWWWDLDQKMYVVGHDLDLDDLAADVGHHVGDDLFEAALDLTYQDSPAVLGTPDDVVLGRVRYAVLLVERYATTTL